MVAIAAIPPVPSTIRPIASSLAMPVLDLKPEEKIPNGVLLPAYFKIFTGVLMKGAITLKAGISWAMP